MKKIVASVGMLAVGASAIQTASAQGLLSPDPDKPWSVSATLRGFYDDNVSSLPDNYTVTSGDKESFGWEISPAASFKLQRPQTALSLGYVYSYKYYENGIPDRDEKDSQFHTFNLGANHAFNERFSVSAFDSFVLGQEPDLLRVGPGNTFETFQRIPGDNIRNYGGINFNADLTRLFAAEVGYANSYADYDDDGVGSLSSRLDRMEHYIHADLKWKALPTTVGILGYQYGMVDYDSSDPLGYTFYGLPVSSDVRNSRSHYIYAGADHAFNPDFTGSIRAGARIIDYYNDQDADTDVAPYVKASLRYYYLPESFLEGGASYDRSPTDVALTTATMQGLTLDADTFTIYGTVSHKIMPKLFGSLTGQFQNTKFNGGSFDGETEQIYIAGVELEYRFSRMLSAHAGYNFDLLDSDLDRDFDRNRVYIGVTASY